MVGKRIVPAALLMVAIFAVALKAGPMMTVTFIVTGTLLAVLMLSRAIHAAQRSRARAVLLGTTGAQPVPDAKALLNRITNGLPGLHDRITGAYPNGMVGLRIRDAWQRELAEGTVTVFELQTLLGYGIPVWQARHGGVLWRPQPAAEGEVLAEDALCERLGLEQDSDLFTARAGNETLIVRRRHPFDGAELLRLMAD